MVKQLVYIYLFIAFRGIVGLLLLSESCKLNDVVTLPHLIENINHLGQIGCGRQNPRFKVLSCRQGSVWLRACHQRVIRIGKRQPLHCFIRNADGTTQVDSIQIGLHEAAALRCLPESLVALAAEVCLTQIGVSNTNDHSRELTVLVQKTELVQTKVK
ncbi:Hypothetical_protein [Hexamita inflata]|uniref:Hypothetical_protein n=1 Tax=Hexamita inflata TaxID=28002 RepID=A0AA86TVX2_9EUKA|nr:Hypothetical protein HINF_LOCUS18404 [Hexamita inflata]